MKHIAIINYAEDEMAIGLGDTEDEAAANAVEAYGGPEHLRNEIEIFDLVDGMRLLYDADRCGRVYRGVAAPSRAPTRTRFAP